MMFMYAKFLTMQGARKAPKKPPVKPPVKAPKQPPVKAPESWQRVCYVMLLIIVINDCY